MLDWSYRLLSKEEQTVFRQLGAFAGGFSLEAAAAIAAPAEGPFEIADAVASLVTKSLLAADASRRHCHGNSSLLINTWPGATPGSNDSNALDHLAHGSELPLYSLDVTLPNACFRRLSNTPALEGLAPYR
jgi:hypothetical protein